MIELKGIGRHMPKARHQRGFVEEVGKRVKRWKGVYMQPIAESVRAAVEALDRELIEDAPTGMVN